MRGVLIHRPYSLHGARVNQYSPDGQKHVHLSLSAGVIGLSGESVDFVIRDKDGNVVADTKAERIKKHTDFLTTAMAKAPVSQVLTSIISSYNAAVADPDNELVHLYEIKDALAKALGGDNAARIALGISKPRWSRFKRLCNDFPLRQGRHRGRGLGKLRDVTTGELDEARGIAREMISQYLDYLT